MTFLWHIASLFGQTSQPITLSSDSEIFQLDWVSEETFNSEFCFLFLWCHAVYNQVSNKILWNFLQKNMLEIKRVPESSSIS